MERPQEDYESDLYHTSPCSLPCLLALLVTLCMQGSAPGFYEEVGR